jgi:hypothetical protein
MVSDLLLTIPVESIVAVALRELKETQGLDRDETYLLARLERADEVERTAALLQAIKDAPSDGPACDLYDINEISVAIRCAEKAMKADPIVTPWAVISHLEGRCGCARGGGDPKAASREPPMGGFSEDVRIPDRGCTHASDA